MRLAWSFHLWSIMEIITKGCRFGISLVLSVNFSFYPILSDQTPLLCSLLMQIMEHWKYHKPRIASYWLVKLDSIKRRKVVDIVRTNVKAVLQRTWKCSDVENLRIYRIVSKVFNRLLWSHGQGLWNCFSSAGWVSTITFGCQRDDIDFIFLDF